MRGDYKMVESKLSSKYISKARLETLVDGIFAIAMTLLVFDLPIPHINPLTNIAFQNSLYSLLPIFISLVLSFILLAVFWSIHRRIFNQIRVTNSILLWINIIWLLFIVLVPFTAILEGMYGQKFILARVIFNFNMIGIALFLFLNCFYVNHSDLIYEKADRGKLKSSERTSLLFILIAVIALLLSSITSQWSFIYLLIIPLELLIDKL
jgi:uncharacterized membrane protein